MSRQLGQREGWGIFDRQWHDLAKTKDGWWGELTSDQAWGSGGANFTLQGSYSWKYEGGGKISVNFYDMKGTYSDDYRFRYGESANNWRAVAQDIGSYHPFPLSSQWEERSRTLVSNGDRPPVERQKPVHDINLPFLNFNGTDPLDPAPAAPQQPQGLPNVNDLFRLRFDAF